MKPALLAATMLVVASSAHAQNAAPPPTIPAVPAAMPTRTRPVAITAAPAPTMPVVRHRLKPLSPAVKRVRTANREATLEPQARAFVNAAQVYPFSDGALYRLYAAPELVSDIALQAGETIISVAAGDTARWTVGDTVSGTGDPRARSASTVSSVEALSTTRISSGSAVPRPVSVTSRVTRWRRLKVTATATIHGVVRGASGTR